MTVNPYGDLFRILKKGKVEYVLIGLSAVNCYADDPEGMFSTGDADALLRPDPSNLLRAIRCLQRAGFLLEAGGEPLGPADALLSRRLVEHRAVVRGRREDGLKVDLVLEAGGIAYSDWSGSRRFFKIEGVKVPVGSLPILIRAKENAGRDKDRKFLAFYKTELAEMLRRAAKRSS